MKSICCFSFFLFIIIFSSTACSTAETSKTDNLPAQTPALPKKPLTEIDLTTIKHTDPKGRVQDGGLQDKDFKELPIAENLLAHGKDSIPFLIGKLDDETKMDKGAMDFWSEVYVGDVALMILNDFFTSADGLTSTIPGFGWDEFLERGNDKDSTGEEILRKYIKKHGRKNIKERWQKLWDENKENIFWDEAERCFKITKQT